MIFMVLFLFALIIRFLFLERSSSSTAAGAIVMAIGIFEYDVFNNFLLFNENVRKYIAFILVICWFFIVCSIVNSIIKKTFMQRHQNNVIQSFAIGTWVAGTSVCATIIHNRIPELSPLAVFIICINGLLWTYYFYICLRNFKELIVADSYKKVHGVILLSTVSTQSLLVAFSNIFGQNTYVHIINQCLFYVGMSFYFISFFIFIKRYLLTFKTMDIKKDWYNTNCILHGAMSITGLAAVISHSLSPGFILIIWYWVLVWFVIIEIIELYRAYVRVKRLGINEGIFKYDVSQWARNFTFGMLYAFNLNLNVQGHSSIVLEIHHIILKYGALIVLGLLVYEIFLFLKDNLTLKYIKPAVEKESGRTENF